MPGVVESGKKTVDGPNKPGLETARLVGGTDPLNNSVD
jgi:hypothetical protein